MRTAYKVLAYIVAAEVAIQAMVMVWAIAGLVKWVDAGGVFDKSIMESGATPFTEVFGVIVHAINGTFVVPAIALLLLIVSFFTKVRRSSGPRLCSCSWSRRARSATWVMSSHSPVPCTASTPWHCSARPFTPVVGSGLRHPRLSMSSHRCRPPRLSDDHPLAAAGIWHGHP
jgi:hypothetical protein